MPVPLAAAVSGRSMMKSTPADESSTAPYVRISDGLHVDSVDVSLAEKISSSSRSAPASIIATYSRWHCIYNMKFLRMHRLLCAISSPWGKNPVSKWPV